MSHIAAAVIAGMPPADLTHGRTENFRWLETARIRRKLPPPRAIETRRRVRDLRIVELWYEHLESDPESSVKMETDSPQRAGAGY